MLQVYFQRCYKIWITSSNRFEFISDAQDSSSMVDNGKITILFHLSKWKESNRFFNSHHGQKPDFNGLSVLHFGLFFRVQKQKNVRSSYFTKSCFNRVAIDVVENIFPL